MSASRETKSKYSEKKMKGLQNVKPGLGATTYAQSKLQSSVVLRALDTFKGGVFQLTISVFRPSKI